MDLKKVVGLVSHPSLEVTQSLTFYQCVWKPDLELETKRSELSWVKRSNKE